LAVIEPSLAVLVFPRRSFREATTSISFDVTLCDIFSLEWLLGVGEVFFSAVSSFDAFSSTGISSALAADDRV